jgi:hypothetical protein
MPGLAPHTMQQLTPARIPVLACPHVTGLACRLRHSSRPVICRGLPGFGASGLPKATSNEWQVPSILLPSSSPGPAEVGTLAGARADSALGSCSFTRQVCARWESRDPRLSCKNPCVMFLLPAGLARQQHRRQHKQQQQEHCLHSAPHHQLGSRLGSVRAHGWRQHMLGQQRWQCCVAPHLASE